jgi:hypothetical protein
MLHRAFPLLAACWLAVPAAPAWAIVKGPSPRLTPNRFPGGAIRDEPIPPNGWRLGVGMSSPWAVGPSLAYVFPASPIGYKVGGTLGMWTNAGFDGNPANDWRAYGAAMYYLTPDYAGGPYFEFGLGLARSSGAVTGLQWPVLPHAGMGTTGRFDKRISWDVTFVGLANGMIAFETALIF